MKYLTADKILQIAWFAVWLSLPLSMRATVFSIWALGIVVIVRFFSMNSRTAPSKTQKRTAALFMLYFAWQAISLVFDSNHLLWWKSLEKKAMFLVFPVIVLIMGRADYGIKKYAMAGFLSGLIFAGIYLMTIAVLGIRQGGPATSFVYHDFAEPLKIGAIYLSWYYSAAIILLVFSGTEFLQLRIRNFLLLFFILVLLLLASKLFILLTIPVTIWGLLKSRVKSSRYNLVYIALAVILLLLSGPFISRMLELKNTDLKVLKQEEFAWDTPLNGLTFRLLQWRFAAEIINQDNVWITGKGINSAQERLDQLYLEKGIYTGNPELGDSGYLGYNFHNQFLETFVSTGLPGLLLLLLIIWDIFSREHRKLFFPFAVYVVSILLFFTESALERQSGIVFFCLLVLTFAEDRSIEDGSYSGQTRSS
jgi:O-antigen ligase